MCKLIAMLLLCLVPTFSFAQTTAPPAAPTPAPSVTITLPKIEATGITMKHVAILAGAMVVGAVLGEAIIGELVGDAIGTAIGLVGGYFIGSQVYEELEDDETY